MVPDPGSLTGNLAKSVDRVVAADAQVQQKARDAAAQAAPDGPQAAPGRPEGSGGQSTATQPGTRP